jgi:hypothetical protein
MKPWQAAAVVTGVVVVTTVLLLAFDSQSERGEELSPLAPSAVEVALNVASFVLVFGVLWLLFAVLRVRRDRRDGSQ